MELVYESQQFDDYLLESREINFFHPVVQTKSNELFHPSQTEVEKAKTAFDFVRDEISHSWDIQGTRVTCNASDALIHAEGICYAKANVLAALLRSQHIPTGFCYQRLMLFDTPEKGYCIHALNAIFLTDFQQWIRIDARGNKKGIDAQFFIHGEKLAFTPEEANGEIDYPIIYTKPHPKTVATLVNSTDAVEMYKNDLPEYL